ncbi:hypothetical protein POM88_016744 [Heracleum sosnowskyi]|uniref:Neprosin activation peptide domain-containing protein n=1 Tax=Heracleum sosnowskyi TaxID=360622 RepID=A0AAD8IN73_9APIA|nr:hypothetical protein POM88_016744 [Heracleum sosnowskyi]
MQKKKVNNIDWEVCLSSRLPREVSREKLEVQKHLNRLNKPPIKSIQSPDGDTIDCIPISHQPAFDHPFLKDHKIQMRPSYHPEGLFDESKMSTESSEKAQPMSQLWHMNGRCPQDTIPVRRTKKDDILRASSVKRYGKKKHRSIPKPQSADPDLVNESGHQLLPINFSDDSCFQVLYALAASRIMIIDFKLIYPSGTATAHLINSFHTPQGARLAKVPAPYALVYRNMSILGVEGFSALPKNCLKLCYVFFIAAIVVNAIRDAVGKKRAKYIPLPMAMAIPFYLGGYFAIDMCVGSLILFVWQKLNKTKADAFGPAVASGLICIF